MASIVEEDLKSVSKKIPEIYIEYSSQSVRDLLKILNSKINESISYFTDIYPDDSEYKDISESTFNSLLTEGYEKINTTKIILDILIIKDECIAHKQIYDECIANKIVNDDYIQSILAMRDCKINYELDSLINLASIAKKSPPLVDEFVKLIDIKKERHIFSQKILFRSSIVYYIRSFILMKEHLKRIS
jgi:disulfide oxidoreductase YuzD